MEFDMSNATAQGTAYGYGTIYQRKSDERWVAAVEEPRHRGMKRRRVTFTALDRETVELKLAAYRADNPARRYDGRVAYMEAARAIGTHTSVEWWKLVRACRGACHYCGAASDDFEMDHKIPVSRGGSDAIDNIVVACHSCNSSKADMTAEEFTAWRAAM